VLYNLLLLLFVIVICAFSVIDHRAVDSAR